MVGRPILIPYFYDCHTSITKGLLWFCVSAVFEFWNFNGSPSRKDGKKQNSDSYFLLYVGFGSGITFTAGTGSLICYFKPANLPETNFKFSYQHYGIHVTYIALLAGYFHYYSSVFCIVWMFGILLLSILMYKDAIKNKSFYFMLLVVLYGYIAVSSLAVRLFIQIEDEATLYLALLYFIGSGIGMIFLLINLNKKLKAA